MNFHEIVVDGLGRIHDFNEGGGQRMRWDLTRIAIETKVAAARPGKWL